MIGLWKCSWFRMSAAVITAATTVAIGEAGNPFRRETSIEKLAKQVDKLERELQYTGRVTVKSPDIWGQARLTAHREEFEREMAKQIDQFTPTINAQLVVSDQAFLQQALALSAAANGATPPSINNETFTTINGFLPGGADETGKTTPSNIGSFTRVAPFGLFGTDNDPKAARFDLEPEIILDQRKRFLDHLHEIRRINEGDDTADSPGYSLNLVRMPVSVIPGNHTRENYGAEATFIVEPHITEELLPATFRELVINDLIDQLALPITKSITAEWDTYLLANELIRELRALQIDIRQVQEQVSDNPLPPPPPPPAEAPAPPLGAVRRKSLRTVSFAEEEQHASIDRATIQSTIQELQQRPAVNLKIVQPRKNSVELQSELKSLRDDLEEQEQRASAVADEVLKLFQRSMDSFQNTVPRERRSRYPLPPSQIRRIIGGHELAILALGAFRCRDGWQCRDRAHLTDIQGYLRHELEFAYDYLASQPATFVDAAQQVFVAGSLWDSQLIPSADEVRRPAEIIAKRESFFAAIPLAPDAVLLGSVGGSGPVSAPESAPAPVPESSPGFRGSSASLETISYQSSPLSNNRWPSPRKKGGATTEVLAWAILVESALLNQQLNDDLKQVSQDPNCGCVYGGPYVFYGPDPQPEAKQAFVQYVKCRWPIRVFALDPVTQQQNVSDAFSLRREGQLAIALAFQKGLINAQSLTRSMRRIEQDIRTISLNNTHVAFGAGDDTFGWRFYPRVQTPDVESNLKAKGRDIIWGGPNRDARLKRWRIEPGMRECVALVVMPSFIKHVRFDVRTSWFPLVPNQTISELTKKGDNGVTLKSTVEWSREVQAVENSMMACVTDEHLYRPGEVERIIKRAQQISRQLPLNTMFAQVPYENTLGGFEMFSSGITDLAPELVGFYGAPGVDPERDTTLFLVGDNFSIHDTRVIAGNALVDTKMLSREVIQVDIPKHVRVDRRLCNPREAGGAASGVCCADGCNDFYVEVRLATPYGVSSPLYVPVVAENGAKVVNICGDGKSPPLSPSPGLPIPASSTRVEPTPLLPQGQWGRPDYPMQYRLAFTAPGSNQLSQLDAARTEILSKAPHQLGFTSPKDRRLPDSQDGKPKARVRIWLDTLNGGDLVPQLMIVKDAELTIKDGAGALSDDAFARFHTALRDTVLNRLQLTAYGTQLSTVKLDLKATIYLPDGKEIAVDGKLPITIQLKPAINADVEVKP